MAAQVESLPVVLYTTSRCHRGLVFPPPQNPRYKEWGTGSAGGSSAGGSPSKSRQGGSGSPVGGGKGEFEPLAEAVKAARSCSNIISQLLAYGPCPPPGATSPAYELLTLQGRATMAMDMVSSTAFGEAVREALVRSPCGELRGNAMGVLENLNLIDVEIAEKERGVVSSGDGGGGSGGVNTDFISLTTVMVS